MSKLKLPNVTLIAVAGNKQAETISSMYKSMSKIDFSICKLITNVDIECVGIDVVNVGGLDTWEVYNEFIIKELYKYFDTDFCLIVQYDSWVLDTDCWTDDFFNFDVVGAKWLDIGKPFNTSNGGFSLRSKKIQKILGTDPIIKIYTPEDVAINKVYGSYLSEVHGINFCTEDIADKFAFELNQPLHPTFGFHNFHWPPYKETIVLKRDCALGDIIMLEPVLYYFFKQGYNVAIDTNEEFEKVYFQHYFPVWSKRYLNPKLKCRTIDLNMAYEIKPNQPVLQSYFEMAGIKDEPLRNSTLNVTSGDNQKLFDKYVLIHIDSTGMEYRDSFGVNWQAIVYYLEDKGYKVFQIGRRIEKPIATYLNTMSLEFMMFLVKGANLVIAHDSGVAQVAVGFNIPSVIFFGSVNPNYRYSNFDKISVVQSICPKKETENCYHNQISTIGKDCVYDKELPPCTQYSATQIINAIKELI